MQFSAAAAAGCVVFMESWGLVQGGKLTEL